ERFGLVPPGVVHQDADRPEPSLGFGDRGGDARAVGHVHAKADAADRFARGAGGLAVDVERRDLCALFGEPTRDRPPDATTRAGHQRDLVFQSAHIYPRMQTSSPTTVAA